MGWMLLEDVSCRVRFSAEAIRNEENDMTDSVWCDVIDDNEEMRETSLSNIVDLEKVNKCCSEPDLWFELMDAGSSYASRVVCKSCGRKGEDTTWSWENAIALWNIALWNPKFMGRVPLYLADRIEELQLNGEVKLSDAATLLKALKEAPRWLRKLVEEKESAELESHMKEVVDP